MYDDSIALTQSQWQKIERKDYYAFPLGPCETGPMHSFTNGIRGDRLDKCSAVFKHKASGRYYIGDYGDDRYDAPLKIRLPISFESYEDALNEIMRYNYHSMRPEKPLAGDNRYE